MNTRDIVYSRWEDMNATLVDLMSNYGVFSRDLSIYLDSINRFFKLYKRDETIKETIIEFYNNKWQMLNDAISKSRLPNSLIKLMNDLIDSTKTIEQSNAPPALINDYKCFIDLLTRVLDIEEKNIQSSSSSDSRYAYISEFAFDFFPAIFFSLGAIKRRLLETQDATFITKLKQFEKLMKKIDKVNYCRRLYSVIDGEFKYLI